MRVGQLLELRELSASRMGVARSHASDQSAVVVVTVAMAMAMAMAMVVGVDGWRHQMEMMTAAAAAAAAAPRAVELCRRKKKKRKGKTDGGRVSGCEMSETPERRATASSVDGDGVCPGRRT